MLGNGETSPRPDNSFKFRSKQWQDLGVVEEKFYVRWKFMVRSAGNGDARGEVWITEDVDSLTVGGAPQEATTLTTGRSPMHRPVTLHHDSRNVTHPPSSLFLESRITGWLKDFGGVLPSQLCFPF